MNNVFITQVQYTSNNKITLEILFNQYSKQNMVVIGDNKVGKTLFVSKLKNCISETFQFIRRLKNSSIPKDIQLSSLIHSIKSEYPIVKFNDEEQLKYLVSKNQFIFEYIYSNRLRFLEEKISLLSHQQIIKSQMLVKELLIIKNNYNCKDIGYLVGIIINLLSLNNIEKSKYNDYEDFLSSGEISILAILSGILSGIHSTNKEMFHSQGVILIDDFNSSLDNKLSNLLFFFLLLELFPNVQFIISSHNHNLLDLREDIKIVNLNNYRGWHQ